MSAKKEIRLDGTYIISKENTANPKLGAKILNDGRESLFLDYYFGYVTTIDETTGITIKKKDRKREYLKLYLLRNPRTPIERKSNKETLDLAKKIRDGREQLLLEDLKGYKIKTKTKINFLDYFQDYIDRYTKKDIRMVRIARQRFIDFLRDNPEYNKYKDSIKPEQLTKDMMVDFTEYLQSRSKGEGAHSIYARFKKVVAYALEHDVISKNPCHNISIKIDENILTKDVLSVDEVKILASTHHKKENPIIRRAFLLCCMAGLRYCDVKDLTFANVDYSNKLLKFEQNKTKGHSTKSGVVIPLNDSLLRLIGTPSKGLNRDSLIFPLPSYHACLYALQRWVKAAGINKHITWHCSRHSFAVNILNNGANIKTVASLLGHSGLKHTEKYTRAVDKLKEDAINSLPEINI